MSGECPKCGGGPMIGPRYGKNAHGWERLFYTCATCFYRSEEPTRDQADRRDAVNGKCTVCGFPANSSLCQRQHP